MHKYILLLGFLVVDGDTNTYVFGVIFFIKNYSNSSSISLELLGSYGAAKYTFKVSNYTRR